ncbi:MAG: alanine--tRNA ligase, partial [Acidobacteria bacterium]|nr:alanine--tRNA ligase [Acidobacteriota bacterium]
GDRIVARVDGYAGDQLRSLAQRLQQRGRRLVVLAGVVEDKVAVVVASDGERDAVATVKELAALVGGGGGGSTTLALAGGRRAEGLEDLLLRAGQL